MEKSILKKVYIGCALTNLPKEERDSFLEMIDYLKKELGKSFEIIEFLGANQASDATPFEVYDFDIKNCVMNVDYLLAICDYPSLGLGYEMATAIEGRGIPVLAVANIDTKVSKLIRGVDVKNYSFFYYKSVDEIVKKAIEVFKI